MIKPNYNDCIINVVESIKRYNSIDNIYPTNKVLDEWFDKIKPKHVVLMILDGLGSIILEKHKEVAKNLYNNKIKDISSVFPSTTSASIPSSITGLAPIETGWTGWENYIKELDKKVVFFKNIDYMTNERIETNIIDELYPRKRFFDEFTVPTFEIGPTYYLDGYDKFNKLVKRIIDITKNNNQSFTYVYWDCPDHYLHEFGTNDKIIKNNILHIDKQIKKLLNLNDTIVIITADHGHKDVTPIYFRKYNDLMDKLERLPSNEGRCTYFKVKENQKEEFKELFNTYFSNDFILITKEEFINNEFLGINTLSKQHPKINEMIGDFVSIAIGEYYFDYVTIDKPEFIFKSHHAGLTLEEITVPLILIKK